MIFVIALSSPQAYFFTLLDDGAGGKVCTVRASLLRGYTKSFWSVWTWTTEMLLFGAVPTSCLILNMRVIYAVSKDKVLHKLPSPQTPQTSLCNVLLRSSPL